MDRLARYRTMRNFQQTPEPEGGKPKGIALRYSIQMHAATRLHWDLRLEWQGVLLSWAVTRGPSTNPADKRLAVRTEDHPFDYLTFEGTIPEQNYGAGTVMLWDLGWWQPFHDVTAGLADGHLHFALHGRRATAGWSLVRMKDGKKAGENWLMVKDGDIAADKKAAPFAHRHLTSVLSNRTMPQIAVNAPARPFGSDQRGAVPAFRAPQLAETSANPPEGNSWLHEVKLDGYRAQVAIGARGVRVRTRSGADWSDRFAELVPVFEALPCASALIDGEIMVGAGLSGFAALQAALKSGGPFRYYAFDLIELDGVDLSGQPLTQRRAALAALMIEQPSRGMVQMSPAIEGSAEAALAKVCQVGGEGIISKLVDAPYRSGRSKAWIKIKCTRRDEFVILGWQTSTSRGRPFASLLLGAYEGKILAYRGKVGTGWDNNAMDDIAERLGPIQSKSSPLLSGQDNFAGIHWVKPQLVAEVAYAERTPNGLLRHARFVALREDKPATEVEDMRVTKLAKSDATRTVVAGVGISSPGRVVFPKVKLTKLGLAQYYADMADQILPTLANRPLSLLRLPDGIDGEQFFQKHATTGFPDAILRIPVTNLDGATETWMAVDSPAGLVAGVQMGAVEFHPWGARIDKLDRPERLVFDLDPDEGLDFAAVRSAAQTLRDRLADLGFGAWAMVSGGKGVHVIVPLRRTATWENAKLFSQLFATVLAEAEPKQFTATMAKKARKGRIFIDWLRNERGSTAVAPFSVRARAGASVAVPVSWGDLALIQAADQFGIDAARERSWNDLVLPTDAILNIAVLKKLTTAYNI